MFIEHGRRKTTRATGEPLRRHGSENTDTVAVRAPTEYVKEQILIYSFKTFLFHSCEGDNEKLSTLRHKKESFKQGTWWVELPQFGKRDLVTSPKRTPELAMMTS